MACIVTEMIEKLEKVKKSSPQYAEQLQGTLDELYQLDQKVKGNTVNVHSGTENGYEGLSNMNAGPVTLGETEFKTVEHAFQYMKAQTLGDQNAMKAILKYESPYAARKIGRSAKQKVRDGLSTWDDKSTAVMERILKVHYGKNEEARELLLSTGDKTITHNNPKWAEKDKLVKTFPKLLMSVRNRLVKAGYKVPEVETEAEVDIDESAGSMISTGEFVREYMMDTRASRHSASDEARRVFREKYRELTGKNNLPTKTVLDQYANKGYVKADTKTAINDAAKYTMEAMDSQNEFRGQFEAKVNEFESVAEQDAARLRPDEKGKC